MRDAECLRRVLGQSFGGLCVVSYLSLAPEGLREALITGGLPPLGARIDDVYRATYARTLAASRRYYERYPSDRDRVRALLARLERDDVRLPGGDRLTPRRLRQLGAMLGMSAGLEKLHHILELPPGSPAFLHDVEAALSFARNPLYAILHEACWADGGATRWSAQRMLPTAGLESEPELFTGEHVFAWMFEEYGALRAAARGRPAPRRARLATAVRPGAPGHQRGAGRRGDLRRRHVRRARVLGADGGRDRRPAPVADKRAAPRRLADRGRPRARAPDRHAARARLTGGCSRTLRVAGTLRYGAPMGFSKRRSGGGGGGDGGGGGGG